MLVECFLPAEPLGKNALKQLQFREFCCGAIGLCKQLRDEGHEIWVYTAYVGQIECIWKMSWLCGIHLQGNCEPFDSRQNGNDSLRQARVDLQYGSICE